MIFSPIHPFQIKIVKLAENLGYKESLRTDLNDYLFARDFQNANKILDNTLISFEVTC